MLPQWTLESGPSRVWTGAETGDSSAFAFVGSVKWLRDGALVIADVASSRLLVYDARGDFVRALGRRGEGPGEIRRMASLAVGTGDTIVTFDPGLRRLSYWHADTGYVRSANLADDGSLDSFPIDAWPWRDSFIVVLHLSTTALGAVAPGAGIRRWPTRAHFTLRNPGGVVLRRSPDFDGEYTGLTERGDIRLPFSNRPFSARASERFFFGSGSQFELSWLDTSFNMAGSIRWPARDERLTTAEVDSVRAEAVALISRRPLPPNLFADNFAVDILPAKRPSIGRAFVDDEGRIWVERYEANRLGTATQKPGNQWSILASDGQPVAILNLPPLIRLEDVRGDDVLVVRRDSLDVQSVAIHRLKK